MELDKIKFDKAGLIPAIIQDVRSGEVLMLAYMNKESLVKTLETGYTHFWSRSRNELWKKGETSGHFQRVSEISIDCDNDTILVKAVQEGVACHTGNQTCFFNELFNDNNPDSPSAGPEIIENVFRVILERKQEKPEESYVSSLFKKGEDSILKKIGEEAGEVIIASKNSSKKEIVWEVADLWFHTLVLLGYHNIEPLKIFSELKRRFGKKSKKPQ